MSRIDKSMWLRRVSQLGLAGALLMPLSLSGTETAEQAEKNIKNVYSAKNSSLQKLFAEIESDRRAALVKASDGNYTGALIDFENLQKRLKKFDGSFAKNKSAEIEKNIRRVKRVYSSEIMKKARDLVSEKKYSQAVTEAQKAQSLTPEDKYIFNFLLECQKKISAAKHNEDTSLKNISPKYQDNLKEIDMNLREAKLLIRKNQLEAAIPKLERVLLVDPFNMEAVQVLSYIYKKIYNVGVQRGNESVMGTDARNVWEWSEPLSRIKTSDSNFGTNQQGKTRKSGQSDLYKLLESIPVESVPYAQSNVNHIIRFLNDQVKDKGIAIIGKLAPGEGEKPVSLELGKTPLLDVIRYFSMASGLSYQISGKQVVFGNVNNMDTEEFPVRGDIIAFIIDENNEKPTSSTMKDIEGGGGGDGAPPEDLNAPIIDDGGAAAAAVSTTANKRMAVDTEALKRYFSDRFITFGKDSMINYNRRTERLRVRNTPENLRRMEALLRQLDALEQPMIMVEVKMVELTNTNLTELGFEWAFSAGRDKGNGWVLGTTDPTRHGNDGGEMFRVLNNLKLFPNFSEKIFGADTKVDLSLSINAVAQNRQAEVLASPRILSENNPSQPAMIKMVENTYFITEWEQPDMESEGFNIQLEGDQPEWDDDARELGVTFTVKPSVNVDNYTITLNDIKPVFYTHVRDYDNYMVYGVYQTVNGKREPIVERAFNLKMPEFSKREITTNITLYDGETVLIGGMVDNEVLTRKDKWPILGDIPFIGNFFRDQQYDIFNRTMLIFITARLMTPKGSPWNADNSMKNRGLVDFSR